MDLNKLDIDKRYEIISPLGEGGMGAVFLANDLKLIRKVAIKVIKTSVLSNAGILYRTKNEGIMLSQLRHTSLASVFEMDMESKTPYIVQEFISGKDLGSLVKKKSFLNEDEAWKLIREQANVLSYLHGNGIVHRDIKPENIIIDKDGRSVLMDFGLALSSELTRITKEGNFVGTMKYCSPEVLKGNDGGERADIYQLGLVVYEAMTGKNLVGEYSSLNEFVALLYERSWEDEPLDKRVPPALASVISNVCRYEPDERPSSGEALVDLIERAFNGDLPLEKNDTRSDRSSGQNIQKTEHFKRGRKNGETRSKARRNPVLTDSNSFGSSADGSRIASSSSGKRIFGAFILFLLILCAFYMTCTTTPNQATVSTESDTGNLFTQSRSFITTPEGFYLFLQSDVGGDLNWTLKGKNVLEGSKREITGQFLRVAGGWKALLTGLDCPSGTVALLSVFDGDRLVGSKSIRTEDSLFKEPFQVAFSYDSISVNWGFHGFSPATVVVTSSKKDQRSIRAGLSDRAFKYVKSIETGSTLIRTSELGFKGELRVSLHLPCLYKEDEVAFAVGENELELEVQIAPRVKDSAPYQVGGELDLTDDPSRKIIGMVLEDSQIFLSTKSGQVFCFDLDYQSQSIMNFRWRKRLRDFPEFANIAPMNDDYFSPEGRVFPVELFTTCLLANGNGVDCYGLGDGSAIYSFDKEGKGSKTMLPYFTTKEAWQNLKGNPKRTRVFQLSSGRLYCSGGGSYEQIFFQKKDSKGSVRVEGIKKSWSISSAIEGMGGIFCWITKGKKLTLCSLETDSESCRMEEIATFSVLPREYDKQPMAFDDGLKTGLFSVNGELYILKESNGSYRSEKMGAEITDGASINGIVHVKEGKFTCIAARGTSHKMFLTKHTSILDFIEVSIEPDTGLITSTQRETQRRILKDPHRCNVIGPYRIDEKRFCFMAGIFFYILSTEDSRVLYMRTFFAAPERLIVNRHMALCTKNFYGAVFGLHLNQFDKEGVN